MSSRLSLYEQVSFKFPELVQPTLVHGFYVAHRLDYSTVNPSSPQNLRTETLSSSLELF